MPGLPDMESQFRSPRSPGAECASRLTCAVQPATDRAARNGDNSPVAVLSIWQEA